jgi:acetyl esterase/lipase
MLAAEDPGMPRVLLVAALLAGGLAACGDDSGGGAAPSASGAASASAATACTATSVDERLDVRYADSAGVDPAVQSLDLYLPEGCEDAPVVVWVHGGAFAHGDKRHRVADKVDWFTGRGWAFASLNYRLVDDRRSGPDGAMYPRAEQDVADAVGWLVDHAGELAIDPGRVALLGHSAGAFLVAIVGTDPQFLDAAGVGLDGVACVAPLDGTYDVRAHVAAGGFQGDMYVAAIGDDPATQRAASPPDAVRPDAGTPAFHVVTRGPRVRVAQSEAFVGALADAGVEAGLTDAGRLGHAEVNAAVGQPGDEVVTPPLTAFLDGCL